MHVFKYLELRSAKEDKVRYGTSWRGEDKTRIGRKLSDLRVRQRQERERRYNGDISTPSTISPGDSSINNSEEVSIELDYVVLIMIVVFLIIS